MFYSDKHISYVEILYFEDKIYIIKIDSLQQFEDFVRACSTSTKYCLQEFDDFCQSLLYFNTDQSDKKFQIGGSCLYLVEVEQALTKSSNC
jgi:hypothetical protein